MNKGYEGIHHNAIWPDEPEPEPGPEPEPDPPSFESKMETAHNSLRKKIEELIRAREARAKKNSGNSN